MFSRLKNKSSGFTLLEILLVIGIIAILAGIVIVAINPSKQLAVVRNTQRKSDLKQIYNAITQYYIDNSSFPSTISTTTLNEVCNTGSVSNTSTSTNGVNCATAGLANLSVLVPTYLVSIPTDPTGTSSLLSFIPTAYAATTATGTGYKVGVNTSKQVLISAPLAELGVTVVVGNVPTTVAWVPISGLVAHYLMNDTNGTTAVDIKGGYTGTGSYTANPSGKINAALSFSGSNGIIKTAIPGFTGNTNFSVSFWAKASGTSYPENSNGVMISLGGDGSNSVAGLWVAGGTNNISFNNPSTVSSINMTVGSWYHIVATYNGTAVKLYVNDHLEAQTTTSINLGTEGSVRIGYCRDQARNWYHFLGSVDDVRIYSRELTSTEITQLYYGGSGTEAE